MRISTVVTTGLALVCLCLVVQAKPKQFAVSINKSDVDLANRTIHFKANRAIDSVEMKIYDEQGDLVSEKLEIFENAAAGAELTITWPELTKGVDNFRIDLKFTDTNEYWVGTSICRFEGYIDHEEVVFESGKWEIRPKEAHKLDSVMPAMLEMVERAANCDRLGMGLYVAGHTDTVGSIGDNRELSRKRARAIAEYFLSHGLAERQLPVYVRGFGEEVLKVDTGDSVDEERNRRADYIISNSPPEIPGPGGWVRIK